LDQVLIGVGLGVEAEVLVSAVEQLARDHRTVMTRVGRDLADRRVERLADDVDAAGLVVVGALQALDSKISPRRRISIMPSWNRTEI
jgi:hypothetical protein